MKCEKKPKSTLYSVVENDEVVAHFKRTTDCNWFRARKVTVIALQKAAEFIRIKHDLNREPDAAIIYRALERAALMGDRARISKLRWTALDSIIVTERSDQNERQIGTLMGTAKQVEAIRGFLKGK